MEEIARRPLFVFCSAFLILSLCFSGASAPVKIAAAAVSAASAAVIFILSKRRLWKRSLAKILGAVFLSSVLAASLSLVAFDVILARYERLDSKEIAGDAVIDGVGYSSEQFGVYEATVFPESGNVKKVRVSMTLGDGTLVPGDRIHGSFAMFRLDDGDGYSERSSLLPDGITMSCEGGEFTYVGRDGKVTPMTVIRGVRETLAARFSVSLDKGAAGLSSAVLLGDRSGLDPALSRDFSRIGAYHLLAISGMHLSILLFVLEGALRRGGVRKGARGALSVLFILFFAALTGFSASVVRAGAMHIIRVAASMLRRDGDPLTALGAAGALILIFDPFAVLDPALWLSLLSAYACVTSPGFGKGEKKDGSAPRRLLRRLGSSVRTTAYVTVCTLPVIWLVFGRVSVLSFVTNLIFIPAVTVYLCLSLLFSTLASFGIVPVPLVRLINGSYRALAVLSSALSRPRFAVFPVSGAVQGVAVAAAFAAAFVLPLTDGKTRRRAFRAALVSLACLVVSVGTAEIWRAATPVGVYVNAGKNDGLVVRENGRYVIADVSDGSWSFTRRLVNCAADEGATETEALVLTHYHRKHVATVYRAASRSLIRRVILPEPENGEEEGILESVSELCAEAGVEVSVVPAGADFEASKGVFVSLGERTRLSRSTHPVVTFSVTAGGSKTAYLGSSFNESVGGGAELDGDRIILGAHPPKYGKDFSLSGNAEIAVSPEAAAYASLPDGAFLPEEDGTGAVIYRFDP